MSIVAKRLPISATAKLLLKMVAAAIVDFQNFKFLTVGRLNRIELVRHAKLGRNRLNRGRDMAFFRFFKMAAVHRLGFVVWVMGPPTNGVWWSLSLCKIWLESMQ